MARLKRSGFRRALSPLAAAIFVSGLLHGASMMITPASACHAGMEAAAMSHSADEHGSHMPGDPSPASDDGMPTAASACPFANVTTIAAPAFELALAQRALRLSAPPPRVLASAILDLPDPPPRRAA